MKWYAYVIMILLWAVAIIVQISWSWWYLLVLLLALNLLQYLFFGLWFGRKTGTDPWLNLFMNLVFGFVWWLPLRRTVLTARKEAAATRAAEKAGKKKSRDTSAETT